MTHYILKRAIKLLLDKFSHSYLVKIFGAIHAFGVIRKFKLKYLNVNIISENIQIL